MGYRPNWAKLIGEEDLAQGGTTFPCHSQVAARGLGRRVVGQSPPRKQGKFPGYQVTEPRPWETALGAGCSPALPHPKESLSIFNLVHTPLCRKAFSGQPHPAHSTTYPASPQHLDAEFSLYFCVLVYVLYKCSHKATSFMVIARCESPRCSLNPFCWRIRPCL